jgi:diguanylate cyclase (GGDEF)-like protein
LFAASRSSSVPPPVAICAIALLTAAFGVALATPSAYWLTVPTGLLAAAIAATLPGAVLGAATVVAAVSGALAWRHVGPLPAPGPALLTPAASVGVLLWLRQRLERDRDQLRGVALSDALTGVANRRLLLGRAEYEISRHVRDGHSFALVILDLDGFKRLNDRFGHAAGDEILCDVAAALSHALRAQDTVARLGGDEFCVLAPETDRGHVGALARRIEHAVASATAGVDRLGASLGAAVFPDDGDTVSALLDAADQRLLDAKRRLYARSRRRAA